MRGLISAFDYLESRLTGGDSTSTRHSFAGSLHIARYDYTLPGMTAGRCTHQCLVCCQSPGHLVLMLRRLAEAFDPSEVKRLDLMTLVDEMEVVFP